MTLYVVHIPEGYFDPEADGLPAFRQYMPEHEHFFVEGDAEPKTQWFVLGDVHVAEAFAAEFEAYKIALEADCTAKDSLSHVQFWTPSFEDEDGEDVAVTVHSTDTASKTLKPFGLHWLNLPKMNYHSIRRHLDWVRDKGGHFTTSHGNNYLTALRDFYTDIMKATRGNKKARLSAMVYFVSQCFLRDSIFWLWDNEAPEYTFKLVRKISNSIKQLWNESDEALGLIDLVGEGSARANLDSFLASVAKALEGSIPSYGGDNFKRPFVYKPKYKRKPRASTAQGTSSGAQVTPPDGGPVAKTAKTAKTTEEASAQG
eukprot:TRINITY_DN1300_c0_g1_i1.p1 TRINITY_DN1300_c0_g1~~TRINITY_DN1300_c0_g1_i1.p1  ORF type:complete len:315 (+),score=64.93 TRINITY_DN1300_c0_g1_i1:14-958(+)